MDEISVVKMKYLNILEWQKVLAFGESQNEVAKKCKHFTVQQSTIMAASDSLVHRHICGQKYQRRRKEFSKLSF